MTKKAVPPLFLFLWFFSSNRLTLGKRSSLLPLSLLLSFPIPTVLWRSSLSLSWQINGRLFLFFSPSDFNGQKRSGRRTFFFECDPHGSLNPARRISCLKLFFLRIFLHALQSYSSSWYRITRSRVSPRLYATHVWGKEGFKWSN